MSLEVKNLCFSYGERQILHNIDFKLNKGKVCALLGPNGVGKSTLFSCILKINEGYTGDVLLNGSSTRNFTHQQLAREIAFIPQSHHGVFNYTVLEVVLMGCTAGGGMWRVPKKEDEVKAMEALESMGILDLKDRNYRKISGGERQLVLIARALAQNSSILIMDEPTANLDYGNQLKVMKRINNLAYKGYTILFSTHSPDHALLYADNILSLKEGNIYAYGAAKEVVDKKLIHDLYNVDVEIMSVNDSKVCVPVI